MRFSLALPLLLWACLPPSGVAQDRAWLLQASYGAHTAAGDLEERFGGGFAIGGGVSYLFAGTNWQVGVRAQLGFGADVKQDVLNDLRTRDGFLIGNQRVPADVQLRERYLFAGPSVGYTLAFGANRRSGILMRTAMGYLRHWIRIQTDASQGVQPLLEEKLAGYDRLTSGPAINQLLGYQLLNPERGFNFFIGLEGTLGLTHPVRAFDVPTAAPPPDNLRNDWIFGARAGLIIPLYRGEGREMYY